MESTLRRKTDPATERAVIESLLVATESSVVYRRRNRSIRPAAVAELLLFDVKNPRSLAFQLEALRANLAALPDASGASRAERLVEEMVNTVRRVDPPARLESVDANGSRKELGGLTTTMRALLSELSDVMLKGQLSAAGWHPAAVGQRDDVERLAGRGSRMTDASPPYGRGSGTAGAAPIQDHPPHHVHVLGAGVLVVRPGLPPAP